MNTAHASVARRRLQPARVLSTYMRARFIAVGEMPGLQRKGNSAETSGSQGPAVRRQFLSWCVPERTPRSPPTPTTKDQTSKAVAACFMRVERPPGGRVAEAARGDAAYTAPFSRKWIPTFVDRGSEQFDPVKVASSKIHATHSLTELCRSTAAVSRGALSNPVTTRSRRSKTRTRRLVCPEHLMAAPGAAAATDEITRSVRTGRPRLRHPEPRGTCRLDWTCRCRRAAGARKLSKPTVVLSGARPQAAVTKAVALPARRVCSSSLVLFVILLRTSRWSRSSGARMIVIQRADAFRRSAGSSPRPPWACSLSLALVGG